MSDLHDVPTDQRQRLLIFNLRTDADDHILGFTTHWINALAPYYGAVDVLTTHAGRIAVADNVRVFSTGREHGASKSGRTVNFYRHLANLIMTRRYDACFAHMQPLFAVIGAPLLMMRGIKTTTWYTHRQLSRTIRLAEKVSYRIVTAVPSSFPLQSPKVRPIGHGIDTDFFAPHRTPARQGPPRIVTVGRLTEIKHQHILLEAAHDLNCEIVLVGDIPDGYDAAYKHRLQRLVHDLGSHDKVVFAGAQTPHQVRNQYENAAVAVNLSPPGLFDKAALEAMAMGVPTVTSNPAFQALAGPYADHLSIPAPDDTVALRDRLKGLIQLRADDRQAIATQLREAVVIHHSLDSLVKKLISVMHTGEVFV